MHGRPGVEQRVGAVEGVVKPETVCGACVEELEGGDGRIGDGGGGAEKDHFEIVVLDFAVGCHEVV